MSLGSLRSNGAFLDAFKDGLRELGYADGKNIVIDVRWAGDSPGDLPRLAASLVKDQPNAIIGTCIPSTRAAKDATRTIPVVMSVDGDPVVSFRDYYKRVARYVDAVLKGTKPADLPVEQPTRIELVINLQTAKALGLAMPQSLLLRADEVIQ